LDLHPHAPGCGLELLLRKTSRRPENIQNNRGVIQSAHLSFSGYTQREHETRREGNTACSKQALHAWEDTMDTRRWLVPFTWGVDMQAIDAVVRLADGGNATLVAASLVSRSDAPGYRGPRLEHIQQSKDFLEAIKWKADRLGVALDQHEVFTVDAIQSITTLARELRCDAIVLVSRGEREALLRTHQLKHLLAEPPAVLLVLRLSSQTRRQPPERTGLGARVLAWLRNGGKQQERATPAWGLPEPEGPLWIRTEQHRRD
jgi:nucleotide-binding universal stress UspA family protein